MEVENKKKILIVIFQNLNKGGVEEYLYNMFTQLANKFDFTVLVPGEIKSQYNKERYEKLGVNVVTLHCSQKKLIRRLQLYFRLNKYLSKNKFDGIHTNTGSIDVQALVNYVAKKKNISNRIAHSHNTRYNLPFYKEIFYSICRKIVKTNATHKVACSKSAAKFMFKNVDDVIIAKNGIEVEKYKYNELTRNQIRKSLGLENKFVIGCIANFIRRKNHKLLIQIFYEIQKKCKNAVLLLVGSGELENEIKQQINDYGIQNKVIFTGTANNVNQILQGIDSFMLCSLEEGLPVSIIEAQTSGLKCVLSSEISKEVDITNNCIFISINAPVSQWVDTIMNNNLLNQNIREENAYVEVLNSGYSVMQCYNIVEQLYDG